MRDDSANVLLEFGSYDLGGRKQITKWELVPLAKGGRGGKQHMQKTALALLEIDTT